MKLKSIRRVALASLVNTLKSSGGPVQSSRPILFFYRSTLSPGTMGWSITSRRLVVSDLVRTEQSQSLPAQMFVRVALIRREQQSSSQAVSQWDLGPKH